jgi:hypothetical protein
VNAPVESYPGEHEGYPPPRQSQPWEISVDREELGYVAGYLNEAMDLALDQLGDETVGGDEWQAMIKRLARARHWLQKLTEDAKKLDVAFEAKRVRPESEVTP